MDNNLIKYEGLTFSLENNEVTFYNNDQLLESYLYINKAHNVMLKQLEGMKKMIMEKIGTDDHLRSKSYLASLTIQAVKEYTVPAGERKIIKVNPL